MVVSNLRCGVGSKLPRIRVGDTPNIGGFILLPLLSTLPEEP
jgi:hypothetical protein